MKTHFLILIFSVLTYLCHSQTFVGTPQTIDSTGGSFSSLAIVDGNPAVAYYSQNSLKFIRATDATGTTWGRPQIIEATGKVGQYISLAIINGNPAISYHDAIARSLKFVRATNSNGSAWGTPITVEMPIEGSIANNTGWFTSLSIVGGNPAIAYLQFVPGGYLKYIRANDANGTTWGTAINLDNPGPTAFISMNIVNDRPAISYYHQPSNSLRFLRANDALGTTWATPIVVVNNEGVYSSLQIINGNPAITFTNYGALYFVRATNIDGTVWSNAKRLDNSLSDFTSLATVAGLPAIAYKKDGNLRFIISNDANGDNWRAPQVIDGATNVGAYASLGSVVGVPAIAYSGKNGLTYIRGNNAFPVKLLNFVGESFESSVRLSWQTNEEVNNEYFEIQRSSDAINFEAIGRVVGKNNSNIIQQYSFDDIAPKSSTNYYRLKQVDYDGSSILSRVIAVDFTSFLKIIVFPNPASTQINVFLPNEESLIKVELLSMGAVKLAESNQPTINLTTLPTGVYWLKILDTKGQIFYRKITISR